MNNGFPTKTITGETVLIVNKEQDSDGSEILTDTEGKKYTRSLDAGKAHFIEPVEGDAADETDGWKWDGGPGDNPDNATVSFPSAIEAEAAAAEAEAAAQNTTPDAA